MRISGRPIAMIGTWMQTSDSNSRLNSTSISGGIDAFVSESQARSSAGRSSVAPASPERLNTKSNAGRTSQSIVNEAGPRDRSRTAGRGCAVSTGRSRMVLVAGLAAIAGLVIS